MTFCAGFALSIMTSFLSPIANHYKSLRFAMFNNLAIFTAVDKTGVNKRKYYTNAIHTR